MITQAQVQIWLDAYGKAWIEGDPDKLVTLFTDDALYQETPFDEPMVGKEAIRAYWQEGAADAQEDVSFSSKVWALDDMYAVAHWQARFTRIPSGTRVDLDGTFKLLFSITLDGLKCRELREWWHRQES